jgi:hypothetical protein
MKKFLLLCFAFSLSVFKSQIAGSFSVPANFPSIAAAIATLNTQGVAGAVTINIAGGYTETAPLGGYQLFNPVGSSATNSVVFQRFGTGANPLITASTGTALGSSLMQDAVWNFIGADNITLDGIDIVDPNNNNTTAMEYGFVFFREQASNGCQNNTIKNCVLNMSVWFTKGILISSATYTNNNLIVSASSASGANINTKIYGNKIFNCYESIAMYGSPISVNDGNNDIGGSTAATGNTIIAFGFNGSGWGVHAVDQYSINISNNVISTANTETTSSIGLTAIRTETALNTNVTILNNTITLSATNTRSSSSVNGIDNWAGNGPANGVTSVNISGNRFPSYYFVPVNTNNGYRCIVNNVASSPSTTISYNSVSNFTGGTGSYEFFVGNSNGVCNVLSNTCTNASFVDGNCIVFQGSGQVGSISNNIVNNFTVSAISSGLFYGVVSQFGGSQTNSVLNNTISNITALNQHDIYCQTGNNNTPVLISGNTVSGINIPSTSSVPFGCWINTIWVTGANNTAQGTGTITGNIITGINCIGTTSTSVLNRVYGINSNLATSVISKNKIYGFNSNLNVQMIGIRQVPQSSANVINNIIGDFNATSSSQSLAVIAYSSAPSSSALIAYNSIRMTNTVNTGANAGQTLLFLEGDGSFDVRNNIFVNTMSRTGTGYNSVIRSNTTSLNYLAASSDNNLYYMGGTQVNSAILINGTSTYTLLPVYKTLVSPREANSITENPPFITTVGSAPNTLSINPLIATQIEGGALPIVGVTDDYTTTARNTVTPDIGAWEGNYLKADATAPIIVNSGFTAPPCNTTNRTFTASISDTSGVATGSLVPRMYYKINFGLYTSIPGVLTSGTSSLGVWTFALTYALAVNDVISYFIVAQDASNFQNLMIVPSTGGIGVDVNTINVAPVPASSYTIQTFPTISVSNGTVCAGRSYTFAPSGASTYSFSGGSAVVSPVSNTSYTITGQSSGGCPSTNTVVATLSVLATPSITVNSGSICLGQSFTMVPSGAISYTYSSGTNIVSPNSSTSYTVAGSNAIGCVSFPATASVTVNTGSITATANPSAVCQGSSVVLTGANGTNFTWSGGVQNNVPYFPTVSQIYTVTGTGVNGCLGSMAISVPINFPPFTQILPASANVCVGEDVMFSITGADSYTWQPGNVVSNLLQTQATASSIFTVTFVGSNGCLGTKTAAVTADPCTSIKEQIGNSTITVYPNPSDGEVHLKFPSSELYQVEVYDVLGKKVIAGQVNGTSPLELKLNKGVYFVSCQTATQHYTSKLVIYDAQK